MFPSVSFEEFVVVFEAFYYDAVAFYLFAQAVAHSYEVFEFVVERPFVPHVAPVEIEYEGEEYCGGYQYQLPVGEYVATLFLAHGPFFRIWCLLAADLITSASFL